MLCSLLDYQEVLLNLSEKTKQIYVLPILTICVCHHKLWSLDVQRGAWHFCSGYQLFGRGLCAKTYYNWLVWDIWNFRLSFGNKSTRSFKVIWFHTKKLLVLKMKGLISNNDDIQVYSCDNLDVKVSFQRTCFGHAFSKLINMHQ